MNKRLLVILFAFCLLPNVQPSALELNDSELQITLDSTLVSKYMWHGFDLLPNDTPALQSSINADWKKLSIGVWSSYALKKGYESVDELDYYLIYAHSFAEDSTFGVDLVTGYFYFDFPNSDSKAGEDGIADQQELFVELSMGNLLPDMGPSNLVPFYGAYYEFHGKDSSESEIKSRWFHVFGLGYDLPLAGFGSDDDQMFNLSWDITYNDGVYGADHDWSHTTLGVATTFDIKQIALTPSINYQWSFEDRVNEDDELYASLSVSYSF